MSDANAKRSKVPPEHKEEARALKALWDGSTRRSTQAVFGEVHQLGNQSNVGHYLNGRISLNAKAAAAFAKELGCKVEEFSPRLAEELRSMAAAPIAAPAAPAGLVVAAPPSLASAIQTLALSLEDVTAPQRKTAADLLAGLALKPETAEFVAKGLAAVLEKSGRARDVHH